MERLEVPVQEDEFRDPRLERPFEEVEVPPQRRESDQTIVSALTYESNSLFVPSMYPSLSNLRDPSLSNLREVEEEQEDDVVTNASSNGRTTVPTDNRDHNDSWVSFTSRTSFKEQSDEALKASIRRSFNSSGFSISSSSLNNSRSSGIFKERSSGIFKEKSDCSLQLKLSNSWDSDTFEKIIDRIEEENDDDNKGDTTDHGKEEYDAAVIASLISSQIEQEKIHRTDDTREPHTGLVANSDHRGRPSNNTSGTPASLLEEKQAVANHRSSKHSNESSDMLAEKQAIANRRFGGGSDHAQIGHGQHDMANHRSSHGASSLLAEKHAIANCRFGHGSDHPNTGHGQQDMVNHRSSHGNSSLLEGKQAIANRRFGGGSDHAQRPSSRHGQQDTLNHRSSHGTSSLLAEKQAIANRRFGDGSDHSHIGHGHQDTLNHRSSHGTSSRLAEKQAIANRRFGNGSDHSHSGHEQHDTLNHRSSHATSSLLEAKQAIANRRFSHSGHQRQDSLNHRSSHGTSSILDEKQAIANRRPSNHNSGSSTIVSCPRRETPSRSKSGASGVNRAKTRFTVPGRSKSSDGTFGMFGLRRGKKKPSTTVVNQTVSRFSVPRRNKTSDGALGTFGLRRGKKNRTGSAKLESQAVADRFSGDGSESHGSSNILEEKQAIANRGSSHISRRSSRVSDASSNILEEKEAIANRRLGNGSNRSHYSDEHEQQSIRSGPEEQQKNGGAKGEKQLTDLEAQQEMAVLASMEQLRKDSPTNVSKQRTDLEAQQDATVLASMSKDSPRNGSKQRTDLEAQQDAAVLASMGKNSPTTNGGKQRSDLEAQQDAAVLASMGKDSNGDSDPNSRFRARALPRNEVIDSRNMMDAVDLVGAFPVPLPALNRGRPISPQIESRPGAFGFGGTMGSWESLHVPSFSAIGNHPTGNSFMSISSSTFASQNNITASPPRPHTVRVVSDSQLVHAMPIEEDELEAEPEVFGHAREMDPDAQKAKQDQYRKIGIFLLVIAILAIIFGLAFGIGSGTASSAVVLITSEPTISPSVTPSMSPSSAPSGALAGLLASLPDYTLESLNNASTPQWKAYDWLNNHRNVTNLPEWRKEQLFVLAAIFYSLEGPSWPDYASSRWLDDTKSECIWFASSNGYFDPSTGDWIEDNTYEGLWRDDQCNGRGDVRTIHLNFLNLGDKGTPHLPREIALLTSLENLDLTFNFIRNNLQDMVPTEVAQMTSLNILHLGFNQLTGTLPSWIGSMSNLVRFDILVNKLTGQLPTEMGNMERLTDVALDGNAFTGFIPTELGRLELRNLRMAGTDFEGQIPSELGRLSRLEVISMLRCNGITGPIPSELGSATNLEALLMDGMKLSGSLPLEFSRLTNLGRLHIRGNAITGALPPLNLQFLTELLLDSNEFEGPIPSELGLMSSLGKLSLTRNAFTGPIPHQLGMLGSLRELKLADNILTSVLPSQLGLLTNLQTLNISNNPFLSGSIPVEFATLATSNQLTTVDLRGSESIGGIIPEDLCYLQDPSCTFMVSSKEPPARCTLSFDCLGSGSPLCGCNCGCTNPS